MPDVTIRSIFNRPPEAAQQYLQGKGYTITDSWKDLPAEAHARTFTVARATRVEILQAIREELQRAMDEGLPFQAFQQNLKPRLQAMGWWGKAIDKETGEITPYPGTGRPVELGSVRRLETIYRTNMQTAYMAGRWKEYMRRADRAPFLQYVAVMDGRTRPSHAALNGRVFRITDPVWEKIYPPNGFNCRCRTRQLTQRDLDRRDLDVSSSEGYVNDVTQPDRRGRRITRTVVKLPGMDRGFAPDLGWDYNPGQAWLKPFTPPPLDALPVTFPQGVTLPGLPTPEKYAAADLLPANATPEEYAAAFLDEFGATPGKPVVFKDKAGDPLTIDESLFQDKDGNWKADKHDRGRFMKLLAHAVKNPDEIWLRWEESRDQPGKWLLKRRYIKSLEIESQDGLQFGLSVFELGQDGWSGSTAMMAQPDRSEASRKRYIEKQRDGFLLYRK
jgi:SPP1 gp7 family putative phage head morphogenesis protein